MAVNPSIHLSFSKFIGLNNVLNVKASLKYPCGFCDGPLSYNGSEKEYSIGISTGNKVVSSCLQAYRFGITVTSKVLNSKPCTNVLIQYSRCPEVY